MFCDNISSKLENAIKVKHVSSINIMIHSVLILIRLEVVSFTFFYKIFFCAPGKVYYKLRSRSLEEALNPCWMQMFRRLLMLASQRNKLRMLSNILKTM